MHINTPKYFILPDFSFTQREKSVRAVIDSKHAILYSVLTYFFFRSPFAFFLFKNQNKLLAMS